MNIIEARVLAAVTAGTFDESRMSNPESVALARLRNSELIQVDPLRLDLDAQLSLGIGVPVGIEGSI